MPLAPSRPAIKLKALLRFPARVLEAAGIKITRADGTYTFGFNYPGLTANAGIPDPSVYQLAIYNSDTQQYERAPLNQLRSSTVAAVRTPRGDADYSIISTDRYIGLTAALTAPRTWALPTAASFVGGTQIDIMDEVGGIDSVNTLTITATGAEKINGASSFVINTARSGVRLISDGTSKWTTALVETNNLADGALAASATGLAKMADGYFTATTAARAKFADGFMSTAKLADGILSADVSGRAKTADKYTTFAKVQDIATTRLLGRKTAGSGPIEELTATDALEVLGGLSAVGQCYLALSGGNLVLSPKNGNRLFIGGKLEAIPSAGVSLAPTGLSVGTLYYIYAYMNSGTMTLEASTTGPAAGSVAPYIGWQIKSGDATRTLVGMAYPVTGPAFADSGTRRLVASYFNRFEKPMAAILATTAVVTATSFGNVDASLSFEFLDWGDEPVKVAANGAWAVSGAATGFARVFFDGTSAGVAKSVTSNSTTSPFALNEIASSLLRGYHVVSVQAYRTGGTNVQFFGTSTGADFACSLAATVNA